MRSFVPCSERFAVDVEEIRVGEEAAEHGDDALVKGKDGAKGSGQILLRRIGTGGLLQ